MNIGDLKGQRVAAFVSGGLDSTTITHFMTAHGAQVVAVTADLGQPDEEPGLPGVPERMRKAGAVEAIVVDGKELLVEYTLQLIQGIAHHEGGYLNTTGIARMATAVVALPEINRRGIKILAHGATGRGNDQVRLEVAPIMLDPSLRVYAPWRDPIFIKALGGRKEMIAYCQSHGLEVSATLEKPYSTDANMVGLTHEAGKLELLDTPTDFVKFVMGVAPQQAPDQEETVVIEFKEGRPVRVNGAVLKLVEVFTLLNTVAGRNGVGIGLDVIENRFVGIKSRGVYESPGATLLEEAYGKFLQAILDREHRQFFEIASRKLADVVYEGKWFTPLATGLLGFMGNVARFVTGTVKFSLYKGNIRFLELSQVPHSLYDPDRSSMESVGEFDHTDSQGLINILDVTARSLSVAGQIRQA